MTDSKFAASHSFGHYYLGTLLRPRRTFDELMKDPRRLQLGTLAIGLNALLYTLVYVFLTMAGGAPSSFAPWLAVPKEVYYSYDRFWLAPSMFVCWILAAGAAQLLGRLFSGEGSFEDNLSAFGFGVTVATLFSLLHDLPDSFLGAIGVLDLGWYETALNSPTVWRLILWTLYTIALILLPVLLTKGVGAAQRVKRGPAILIGILSAILYQGMFLVFNR